MEESQVKPTHIGFIVDGNRRWARERNLPTFDGHKQGLDKVEKIIEAVAKAGIPFASFYLFSTENWNRSKEEVSYLMDLAKTKIKSLGKTAKENDFRCVFFSANNNKLDPELQRKFTEVKSETKECKKGTICFCFNYGGQQEIAEAAEKIAKEKGEFTPENIEKHLYYPEVPPCDLIVRTSGEERISGFMLWRAAYSEFLFLEKYWPEIEPDDLKDIIDEFESRSRRFGK